MEATVTAAVERGLWIKHGYPQEFVNEIERLFKKYGEEIFNIQGIANSKMDIVEFSKDFFKKSFRNVADLSVDDNANVNEKNILQYNYENNKALMRLNSLFLMYKYVKKCYSKEAAQEALEKVINGEIFINDLSGFHMPYCYAFDLRNLVIDGMSFYKGNFKIGAPKRASSFIALTIQTTAYISNQIMGAASFPSFFVIFDWFLRKELGTNYAQAVRTVINTNGLDFKEYDKWITIKEQFQNLIYSFNFPFRGNQCAFTNLSVLDRGFLKSLFKGYTLPDFTEPDIDSTLELSKLFFEYYTHINSNEGMFTFPIMTIAASLDETGEYLDPEFIDWAAKANCTKALANIFIDRPTSFSSCCRMRSDVTKVSGEGYHNSFGVGGLSIGSLRVAGLNLPRMAYLEVERGTGVLEENLEIVHKILYAHRQLIKTRVKEGYMPLYSSGWIDINKQYSTVGFVGAYEYIKNKNLSNGNGTKRLKELFARIESKIVEWQEAEVDEKNMYNLEQIPAESMAVRLARMDQLLEYNLMNPESDDPELYLIPKYQLYSNQYIPLTDDASIYERFVIQGDLDQHTSGGAILHLNIDDQKPRKSVV